MIRSLACLMLAAALVSGCAAVPLVSRVIPHFSSRSEPALRHGYRETVGVIHIHSTHSDDGTLPVEAIARIANRQELDFLIFTDHDTLQARREGQAGWRGETLALIDEEISTDGGHYLALNIPREVPRLQDARWTIEEVSALGGLGFIAHPFWKRKPWKYPEAQGITGIEIYSGVQDISEENLLWLGLWTVLFGSEFSLTRWLDRPTEALALWDRLLSRGERVTGIGSPDAHGLRRFGLRLGPYEAMFKLVRNHLLVQEISSESVYEALRLGRLFVAHDLVADARGFSFLAVHGKTARGTMGDFLKWKPELQLYAYLPSPGEMVLFRNGKEIARGRGQQGWFPLSGPGIYRLEATRGKRPWIYSNPIYVIE